MEYFSQALIGACDIASDYPGLEKSLSILMVELRLEKLIQFDELELELTGEDEDENEEIRFFL